MSTVSLQFGQYGNQLGPEFFTAMYRYAGDTAADLSTWFSSPASGSGPSTLMPRTLLIDMEPKAILTSCLNPQDPLPFSYSRDNVFYRQSGSANNWACGYVDFGARHCEEILDLVQRETERVDKRLDGFLSFLSLSGGTGSGLGSCISASLADYYPKTPTVVQAVLPFESGEVLTQQYNMLLSLSILLEECDGVLLFGNDEAKTIYNRTTSNQGSPQPRLAELNKVIAHNIALNLLAYDFPVQSLIRHCIPNGIFRMLAPRATPSRHDARDRGDANWFMVSSLCRQLLITGSPADCCLDWNVKADDAESAATRLASARLTLHGCGASNIATGRIRDIAHQMGDPDLRSAGASSSRVQQQAERARRQRDCDAYDHIAKMPCERLFPLGNRLVLSGFEKEIQAGKTAGLILNGDVFNSTLTRLVDDVSTRVRTGAYLWHYEKFGIGVDYIRQASETICQTIQDYKFNLK